MRAYLEFSLANLIYYAMKEGACSEQSSRMTAMDAASKNAGKLGLISSQVELPRADLSYLWKKEINAERRVGWFHVWLASEASSRSET